MPNIAVVLLFSLIVFLLVGASLVILRYSREINAARKRIDSLGSQVIETACGPIEYAKIGKGPPLLVVHGALGGFDHGLWLANSFHVTDYQVISVSRLGYLDSPIPADADLNMQADLFAGLLDSLKIKKVAIFAISAGSTSAIRFAARHPERVSNLVLIGPDSPGEVQMPMPPRFIFNTLFRSDFIFWILKTYFSKMLQNAMGLVPKGYIPTYEDQVLIKNFLTGILPVSKRIDGLIFESYNLISEFNESVTATSPYPLKDIHIPVLVVNALDDPLSIANNVKRLAEMMPNAKLFTVPDGGHFFFGHSTEVRDEIALFL
jgi:pimeloyl-ACP methyl ester carboxylesterase